MRGLSFRRFVLLAVPLLGGDATETRADGAPVVAVFDIQDVRAKNARLSPDQAQQLSGYLASRVSEGLAFRVVPREQIREALQQQKAGSYKSCFDQSCQVQLGKALAAQKSLATTVSQLGKTSCAVSANLLDLRTEVIERSATARGACDVDGLVGSLEQVVQKLLGQSIAAAQTPPPAPDARGTDYSKLAREAEQAEAARKKRLAAIEDAFTAVKGYAETASIDHDKRISALRKFIADFPTDNPRIEEAAGLIRDLERGRVDTAWDATQRYARLESIDKKDRVAKLEQFLADFPGDNPHKQEALLLMEDVRAGGGAAPKGMVKVPGGSFTVGCVEGDEDCHADEKPLREMSLPTFFVDQYETTVEEYRRCANAGACSLAGVEVPYYDDKEQTGSARWCNWNKSGRDRYPMNCVTWAQADAYCRWMKKRLPTEWEWEKAARGTDGRKYPWGNLPYSSAGKVANIADAAAKRYFESWNVTASYDDGVVDTTQIGSFPQGVSPYGAHDMMGNVLEWNSNWYEENKWRSARGGSWRFHDKYARASDRWAYIPEHRAEDMGIRCVK